jgi:hypothetical protein
LAIIPDYPMFTVPAVLPVPELFGDPGTAELVVQFLADNFRTVD